MRKIEREKAPTWKIMGIYEKKKKKKLLLRDEIEKISYLVEAS